MGKINTQTVGALISISFGFLFLVIGVATKAQSEGEAAYALLVIAVLASVASLCSMAAYAVFDFMEKMNEIVAVMPKVAFVSALVGGVFAIIGIIIFAATFYSRTVEVNYSLFLTCIGAISLLGGGVAALKSDKGTQVAA